MTRIAPWRRQALRPLYALRGRVLTPGREEVDLTKRGFARPSRGAEGNLATAGNSFLDGFEIATSSAETDELVSRLEDLPGSRRGFAYEGAGMALAILDGIPLAHGNHVRGLLAGMGDRHAYMIYVGCGWALARLPRKLWRAATQGLDDPVLSWLVLDGYGFHQAYFKTQQYVYSHRVEHVSWPPWDSAGYGDRVLDQGIGRAMWFVEGADPTRLADRIASFQPHRRGDLYAGVGLAATYAAGADATQLGILQDRAGEHLPSLLQGSIFAAEARRRAGNVTADTERAVASLTGLSVADAADVAVSTRPTSRDVEGIPAFEAWRQRISTQAMGAR